MVFAGAGGAGATKNHYPCYHDQHNLQDLIDEPLWGG